MNVLDVKDYSIDQEMKDKRPQSLTGAILKTMGKSSVSTTILKVLRSELTFVCKVGGS